jgi:hypothetical protein
MNRKAKPATTSPLRREWLPAKHLILRNSRIFKSISSVLFVAEIKIYSTRASVFARGLATTPLLGIVPT